MLINALEINDGFERLLHALHDNLNVRLVENESRYGHVRQIIGPLVMNYHRPEYRVLGSRLRNCNPFFHLYEALWMLAGRNDVYSVANFAKRMATFSDNGETFHAAYGHRWRQHFGGDQLAAIINTLKENPKSRRCYLQMWNAQDDLVGFDCHPDYLDPDGFTVPDSKDLPCNVGACFQLIPYPVANNRDPRSPIDLPILLDTLNNDAPVSDNLEYEDRLNMTVFNRSNDIFWGMLGSNYVHFTMLQEYIANMVGVPIGMYTHMTANAHYYTDLWSTEALAKMDKEVWSYSSDFATIPLVTHPDTFDEHLNDLVDEPYASRHNACPQDFIRLIAAPMMSAHYAYSNHDYGMALKYASDIAQQDWRNACVNWLVDSRTRRNKHRLQKASQ
jgi:thymidylate synthase